MHILSSLIFLSIFSATDPIYNASLVAGKIVLVFPSVYTRINADAFEAAKSSGAVGIIYSTDTPKDFQPCRDDLPCIRVDYTVGTQILLYIRSTKYVIILKSEIVKTIVD